MGSETYQKGSLQYVYQARSDVGQVRSNNEDTLIEEPTMGLFGVCDGLGGHAAGEVASSIAAETLKEFAQKVSESPEGTLESSIQEANRRILSDQAANPEHRGMGTTATSLWLVPENSGSGWIGHVGDSRMYRQREEKLEQLTEDHSPVFASSNRGYSPKIKCSGIPRRICWTGRWVYFLK